VGERLLMGFLDSNVVETNHECPRCKYKWRGQCEGNGVAPGQGSLLEPDTDALELPTPESDPPATSAVDLGPVTPQQGSTEVLESPSQPDVAGVPAQTEEPGAEGGIFHAKGTRSRGKTHGFDEPSPTLMAHGIADNKMSSVLVKPETEEEPKAKEPAVEQTALTFVESKPPYRIPSMDEIRSVERNGLTVVSTFSGCGGSSLGFKWAGFRSLFASEFVPAAADTYHANFPDVPLGIQDVRELEPALLMERLGLERGELDVLEGSPPCASFSMAGKRDKHWGEVKKYSDVKQRTDDLLMEYVRLVDGFQPRAFVMENVYGLTIGVAAGYLNEIIRALTECGYRVWWKVLDAQWLGVPQRRRRVIVVGFRNDVAAGSPFTWYPEPLTYRYSIRDALPWLSRVKAATSHGPNSWDTGESLLLDAPAPSVATSGESAAWYQHEVEGPQVELVVDRETSWKAPIQPSLDDPIDTITSHGVSSDAKHDWKLHFRGQGAGGLHAERERTMDDVAPTIAADGIGSGGIHQHRLEPTPEELEEANIERFAIGREWEEIGEGGQSDKYLNLIRPDSDEPSPTVTQMGGVLGAASVTHPTEPRKFTIAELKRLCGFPDDFELTGSYRQQWERMGRAVPPPMMRAVAESVARVLLRADE